MIERIIEYSIRNKFFVIIVTLWDSRQRELPQEGAVGIQNLYALVLGIGHVDVSCGIYGHARRLLELSWPLAFLWLAFFLLPQVEQHHA